MSKSTVAQGAKVGLVHKRTVVEKDAFLEGYEKAGKKLSEELDRVAKDPDEEAVHEARTAIRRLETRVDILPKELRKSPEMKDLLESLVKVMKRSAKVRDLDVMLVKLSRHKGPATARLVAEIRKKRRKLAKDVVDAADSARKLPLPKVKQKEATQRALQKRFEKVEGKLSREIEVLLPIVTMDRARLEELHKLRIDSKKLRYTLEVTTDGGSPDIERFEGWQDALGAIHDWDVAATYLREAGTPGTADLLRAWVRERDREFEDFARSVLNPA